MSSVLVGPVETDIPPLENGDQLHSSEFLRRYDAMPHIKKAELVEGLVFMASPVSPLHGGADNVLHTWIGVYAMATEGILAMDNTTVVLDSDNAFQPDGCLVQGGHLDETKEEPTITGVPKLVVEVAASSVSLDTHAKKRVYQRCGVPEYVVWRVRDQQVDWWHLENQEYVPVTPNPQGHIQSITLPGLVLNVSALLNGDYVSILTTLQNAIAIRDGQGSQSSQ